jgi:hypothetical protein
MICPLSDNFRTVIVKVLKCLNELEMNDTADVLRFVASLDYSESEGELLRRVKMYLHTKFIKKRRIK